MKTTQCVTLFQVEINGAGGYWQPAIHTIGASPDEGTLIGRPTNARGPAEVQAQAEASARGLRYLDEDDLDDAEWDD